LSRIENGFTLPELLIVISLVSIAFISFGTFFLGYLTTYTHYQTDASNYTELDSQSERISQVIRAATDIVSASSNDLVMYAYFSPDDTYVSQVHYYLSANGKQVLADITPMTANPPIGTLITAKKLTYTIISNYYQATGGSLFSYYDASGDLLSLPITDEHSIIQIQVNLAEPGSYTKTGQNLSVMVGLRNRKTSI
jgi:prepilin-type N-terminal cleavage/methylation domain-containing protein